MTTMIFKFRVLSDENDYFLRDYEIPYDINLLDFHNYICRDLNYDPNSGASFFLSNVKWERLQEYTLFDIGEDVENPPLSMEKTTLGQIIHQNNDRLIYVFDIFGNRALFLELIATHKATAETLYPLTSLSEQQAPDQFDSSLNFEDSIFDEALGDLATFEGDDSYDDEY